MRIERILRGLTLFLIAVVLYQVGERVSPIFAGIMALLIGMDLSNSIELITIFINVINGLVAAGGTYGVHRYLEVERQVAAPPSIKD